MSDVADRVSRGRSPELSGEGLATRLFGRVPERIDVDLGGFGRVALTWEGPGTTVLPHGETVAFRLSRGPETGHLLLDAGLANRIVAVALGADVALASALGRLGPSGRGIVGGFVAGVLHAVGAPLAVSLATTAAEGRPREAVGVAIRVMVAGAAGWATLEAPRGWLEDAIRIPDHEQELAASSVEVALELARTRLNPSDLQALTSGDAVVFDGEEALSATSPWPARLVVGDYAAAVAVAPGGAVAISGTFRPTGSASDGGDSSGRAQAPAAGEAVETEGQPTAPIARPVEVVIELARFSLRGDEVLGLGPGVGIAVPGARRHTVVLRVGGEAWADGELVAVDGALAVRVTGALRAPVR